MEPTDEQGGSVDVEDDRVGYAAVLILTVLDVLTHRAEPVVALTHLVVGDVHVVPVGVRPLRMTRAPFAGAGDRAVSLAHVAELPRSW